MQATAPERDQLRRLAELEARPPRRAELYLDLDLSEFATPPARATAVRSVLDEAERRVREHDNLPHDDRVGRWRRRCSACRPSSSAACRGGGARGRRVRERAGGAVRGDQAAALGQQQGGDRALAAGGAARPLRAPRALVHRAR